MKKLKMAVLSLVLMLALSGCVRYNTTISIKSNGKADVSMTYAMMTSMLGDEEDEEEDDSMNESMDELRKSGWQVEKYDSDGYQGIYAEKKDLELTSLSQEIGGAEGDLDLDNKALTLTKEGSTYIFDWKFEGESASESKEYVSYIESNGGYMTFTLKLPHKAKKSNATKVLDGGKTLEWNLLALDETNSMHVEFSTFNPLIIVIIVVAAVALVAIIVVVVLIKKKK